MRRTGETAMLAASAGVGLVLTGVTIWAVAAQNDAIQEREWSDVRNSAQQAAIDRRAAFERDLERSFQDASRAFAAGGANGLDAWMAEESGWPLAFTELFPGIPWGVYPLEDAHAETRPSGAVLVGPQARALAAAARLRHAEERLREAVIRARWATSAPPPAQPQLSWISIDGPTRVLIAMYTLGGNVPIALVAPSDFIIARYWFAVDVEPVWDVHVGGPPDDTLLLTTLRSPFQGAYLVASKYTLSRQEELRQRRAGFLALTVTGMAAGWSLVSWMLVRAVRRQRELVSLQQRFVADVSHELKTPLALIRLLAETLQAQRIRDPHRAQEYLETITRESERLTVLLDSILDFSRIERGMKQYSFSDCDVGMVARQAWTLFAPQFASSGFNSRVDIEDNLPVIHADGQALQQVLVNLLQNAYRYGAEGKYVRLNVRREGFLVVMTVEDHGIGMTNDQLRELGASFYRAPDPRVRRTRGTGLGLTIVNHIVTAHGGKLEVQSREGAGSAFTVWLPLDPRRQP
ncbi:Alkaline phosphatase synthesis sensor protein PhoR [Phycisphaerae bacterium RAS1]|nr:Alkaline phosphatase synthesis sensor protein PhoR [Phycisphaerae bacterium RAS1]